LRQRHHAADSEVKEASLAALAGDKQLVDPANEIVRIARAQ
jgi:hypothetical protein